MRKILHISLIGSALVALLIMVIFTNTYYHFASKNCTGPIYNEPDVYNFSKLGIQVATYNKELDEYVSFADTNSDLFICKNNLGIPGNFYPKKDIESVLVLRTSQETPTQQIDNLITNNTYKNIIILCDNYWNEGVFTCTPDNVLSDINSIIFPSNESNNYYWGNFQFSNKNIFVIPETQLNNREKFKQLYSLLDSISQSQHIKEMEITEQTRDFPSNNQSTYLKIIIAYIVYTTLLSALIAFSLKFISIRHKLKPELIALVLSTFLVLITLKTLNLYDPLRFLFNRYLQETFNISFQSLPTAAYIPIYIVLFIFTFYISYLSLYYLQHLIKLVKLKYSFPPIITRYSHILLLIFAFALSLKRPVEIYAKIIFMLILVALILYILYIPVKSQNKNDKLKMIETLVVVFILITAFVFGYRTYQIYRNNYLEMRNKYIFHSYKYITTPYLYYMPSNLIAHDKLVSSDKFIYINDFLINHPLHSKIEYTPNLVGSNYKNDNLAFNKTEENHAIKEILQNIEVENLYTDSTTPYFQVLNKDLPLQMKLEFKILCENKTNSEIYIETFRLNYDKTNITTNKDLLLSKAKCNKDEIYKTTAILDISDISKYAGKKEIFKLSSTNKILSFDLSIENERPLEDHIRFLNFTEKDNYVYLNTNESSNKLTVIDPEINQPLELNRAENTVNIGRIINILRMRDLIGNNFIINSFPNYTVLEFIENDE